MENVFARAQIRSERITQRQKNANKKQWYKDKADLLDNHSRSDEKLIGWGGISEYKRKSVNYNLFNNQVDIEDLKYVIKPFGEEGGELPANFMNRDIVSPKIKVLLGMEMKMPFSWKVIAVNEQATTRKEQEQAKRMQQFVTSEIMKPIRMQLEQEAAEQSKGKSLTPEEKQEIQQQIEEELKAQTPDEVKKYMAREHQDPAEEMMHQILEYLILEQEVSDKFNQGFKHSLLGGHDIYHVGIFNGKPGMSVVDNLGFNYDEAGGKYAIENGQWATCEYRWTPSEVVARLGSELETKQIDKIFDFTDNPSGSLSDATFDKDSFNSDRVSEPYTVRVLHCTWKSLMKIQFLIYNSEETGQEEMMIVDENYVLNEEYGDISVQTEWIPQTHEAWKIMSDIYVMCRPVPGQPIDLDNLWDGAKLPYYGAACDNMNSAVTSAMDRIKGYQYLYDVIIYRIELLMASDKGKILVANIKSIPKSAGIDTKKFIYFMEANKLALLNPTEEGNRGGGDVTNMVKEIDMSLASDISKYIELAEYIETKCGASIGVTKPMEGQISPTDAVTNTKQNLVQASHIVQPYFQLHNVVKGKVLKALVETAKVAYSENPPSKLSYVLDDMSTKVLTVDEMLLDSSTYGLFISNSGKAEDAKNAIINLAQAAMQNQQADLLDIAKILRAESMNEVDELLTLSKEKFMEQEQASEKARLEAEERMKKDANALRREEMEHEKDMILLKAKEDRTTKLRVAAVQAMGFNEDKDMNDNNVPDVLEIAEFEHDIELKGRKQDLDEQKFEHQKGVDKQKLENDKQKIAVSKIKKTSTS